MTAFEHLSVLISIVLGLGIAHLLTSFHQIIEARARVKRYWLSLVWSVVLFIGMVEWWWAIFGLQDKVVDWTFFYFLFVLLSPVTLYLAAAFALPGVQGGAHVDMREYYYRERGWFFGMVAAGPVCDFVRRGIDAGSFADFGALTNLIAAALLGTLAFSDNEKYHAGITLAVLALFLVFIISSALNLGG